VDAVISQVRRFNFSDPVFFLIYDIRYAITIKNTKMGGQIREMFLSWRMGILVVS
jgi:hypothetical protein